MDKMKFEWPVHIWQQRKKEPPLGVRASNQKDEEDEDDDDDEDDDSDETESDEEEGEPGSAPEG